MEVSTWSLTLAGEKSSSTPVGSRKFKESGLTFDEVHSPDVAVVKSPYVDVKWRSYRTVAAFCYMATAVSPMLEKKKLRE